MLLEFSCSNHRSVKEKITFSMIAGKDNTDEDKLMLYDKYRVLRSSVIYGANGSGKSNFVDAVQFVKNLVINSINHQPGQGIRQMPHKLLGMNRLYTDSWIYSEERIQIPILRCCLLRMIPVFLI